jgi:hypothetical protein
MMLKIVPFLVWYRVYAPRAGRTPVPGLADLGWPTAEAIAFVGLTVGVATLAAGVAMSHADTIRAGSVIVLVGTVGFAATLGTMLHHLLPCPLRTAPKPS